jgi:hypothetical protein
MRSYLAKQLNNTQVTFIIIMRRPEQTSLQGASWALGQRINIPISSRATPKAVFKVALRI